MKHSSGLGIGSKKKEASEAQKKEMVEEVQRAHHKSVYDENAEMQKMGEGNKRSERRPRARQTLGKFWKRHFFLLILHQNWPSVSAAAEGPQRKTEAVMRMQQEMQIKASKWSESQGRMVICSWRSKNY